MGAAAETTTIDPGCVPNQSPNPVRDDCGVFVSSSQTGKGDGTKGNAYATIAEALGSPKSGPIYLCAEVFTEAVQIGAGKTIYGGLDCANEWKWIGATTKSEVSPDAGQVPLVVEPGVGVVIEDVRFRAKDSVEAGGSSIGVIATTGAALELSRCNVEAGNAKDGAVGEAFATSGAAGAIGNAGANACTASTVVGGSSLQNACDDADPNDNSVSGLGGNGTEFSGGAGTKGQPGASQNAGQGEDDVLACTPGTVGDDGASGTSSGGAQGLGTISAQGYSGLAGTPGEKGKTAQGGGGGGGAKGGVLANQCTAPNSGGASGGSGGSGGCGGKGGNGGQAGGASIGILSLGASFIFTDVAISSKKAGKGGDGGVGQVGGMGGPGGLGGSKGAATALKDGCSGGAGGKGGDGGRGGGGLGGHSIGIAFMNGLPDTKGATITIGTPGNGGLGDGPEGTGAVGLAAETKEF